MGKKVILSADSTCDLTPELKARYTVNCYPYHIILDGKDYLDNVDITPADLFKMYREHKILPKTAAVNVYEYVEYFRQWTDKGYEVVHLNLSGALSLAHRNCCVAAEELGNVYPIDSCNLSTGTGLLVLEAFSMIEAGMCGAEIKSAIEAIKSKVHASFILDTLRFMHAGGRCSGVTALSASMLNIKPCILVDNSKGTMTVGKKYRGSLEKIHTRYVADMLTCVRSVKTDRIFITHSGIEEKYIETVKKAVLDFVPFKEVFVTRASCTISSHCGPNCLGILFMSE